MKLIPLDEIVFQAEPHRYRYRGKDYRSVTDYITGALGDDFKDVPQDRLEYCQDRGNAVHMAGELLVAGELDWSTVDPRIEGYVRAIERFHNDCPGKIVYAEKPLVSPEDGLAGRPDIVKFISGRRALVDYKTSQQMTPRMRLQTAGYFKLHNRIYPNAPIYDRYGLRLQLDGLYKLVRHEDPDDLVAFDDLLAEGHAKERAERWHVKYGLVA